MLPNQPSQFFLAHEIFSFLDSNEFMNEHEF